METTKELNKIYRIIRKHFDTPGRWNCGVTVDGVELEMVMALGAAVELEEKGYSIKAYNEVEVIRL